MPRVLIIYLYYTSKINIHSFIHCATSMVTGYDEGISFERHPRSRSLYRLIVYKFIA